MKLSNTPLASLTFILALVASVSAQGNSNGNGNGNSNNNNNNGNNGGNSGNNGGNGNNGNGGVGSNRVQICHGTASPTNPYVLIEVDDNAASNNPGSLGGHLNNPQHNDPTRPKNPDVLPNTVPDRYPNCIVDERCHLCCSGVCIGDPHILTWSGEWYDFHGQCDLVFLQNPSFDNGKGMDLQVRTTIRAKFSFIEVAALRIGDDILEVSGWGEYLVNGVESAHLPKLLGGKYQVKRHSERGKPNVWFFTIELAKEKYIKIQTFKDLVSVKLEGASSEHFGGSSGLMGEFGTGRRLARDGETVLEDPNMFGQDWQVLEHEPMLFTASRFPQYLAQCIMPPKGQASKSRRLGESIAEAAVRKACSHWNENMVDMCVYDVMATGDLELAQAGSV